MNLLFSIELFTESQGFYTKKWVSASSPLSYTIHFENDPEVATAPAQYIRVTQKLDSDLDFRTFRVSGFGFGDVFVDVPENRTFYQTSLDFTTTQGILVDVTAGIDTITGEAFWEFSSIDYRFPTLAKPPSGYAVVVASIYNGIRYKIVRPTF